MNKEKNDILKVDVEPYEVMEILIEHGFNFMETMLCVSTRDKNEFEMTNLLGW